MKKSEMIKRLEIIETLLNMTHEEYAYYVSQHHESELKTEDVMAYRTGHIKEEINYILNN